MEASRPGGSYRTPRRPNYTAPHFDLPFRYDYYIGSVAVVEQDSNKDVLNCVHAVVRYPRGFRLEQPEFGISELVFQTNPDLNTTVNQINEWEPRASISLMEEIWDFVSHTLRARLGVE